MTFFIKSTAKKYIFAIMTILILISGIILFKNDNDQKNIIIVQRGNVVQEVVSTAKIKARQEADLGFDKNGRIARVNAEIGSRVRVSEILAELDLTTELANLEKERSLLSEEQSKLEDEGKKIASSIREAYAASDNAVRNKTDQFFKTPRATPLFEVKFSDGNYEHYFPVPNDLVVELNGRRKSIELILVVWLNELPQINTDNAHNLTLAVIERMNTISDFLNKIAYAINSFTPADFAYENTVVAYKTAIDSARTGIATARDGLISANSAALARVNQKKASVLAMESVIQKSKITAPFDGIVTKQDAKVGQVVSAGEPLLSLISEKDMYLEAEVSEVNIAKVLIGNNVRIKFDAYPDKVFKGSVSFIDPAETVVNQVINYKIRVEIEKLPDPEVTLRSGLTAAIIIISKERENALNIPVYAIIEESNGSFVNKLTPVGQIQKVPVQVGITGSNGQVEVISGLDDGDRLIIAI